MVNGKQKGIYEVFNEIGSLPTKMVAESMANLIDMAFGRIFSKYSVESTTQGSMTDKRQADRAQ